MPAKPVDFWKNKCGGVHTTLIGDRAGRRIASLVASDSRIKKLVPGIIKVKGPSGGSFRAKVLRPDNRGNLRMLFAQGTSFQEIVLITTAADLFEGEAISKDLNLKIEKELKN